MRSGEHAYHIVQFFAVTACSSASLLIVFRTYVSHVLLPFSSSLKHYPVTARVAIWNRNKIISTIAVAVWLANVSFLIYSKSVPLMPR